METKDFMMAAAALRYTKIADMLKSKHYDVCAVAETLIARGYTLGDFMRTPEYMALQAFHCLHFLNIPAEILAELTKRTYAILDRFPEK